MPDTREIQKIMQLQNLAGFEKFSKRTIAEELERFKLIELVEAAGDKALYQHIPLTADIIADHLIANGATIPVRCKDCEHGIWDEENEMWRCVESAEYDSDFGDYIGFTSYHNADYFCADGERRKNG